MDGRPSKGQYTVSERACVRKMDDRLKRGVSHQSMEFTLGICPNCGLLWASVWYKTPVHDMDISEADRILPCLAA